MTDQNGRPVARLFVPMVRRACANLAGAIGRMDRAEVERAIRTMATDPTEVIIFDWEPPTRMAEFYETGGDLDAQVAELSVLEDAGDVSVDQLRTMLAAFATSGDVRVRASMNPWRIHLQAPGLPRLTADVIAPPEGPEDLVVRVMIGSRGRALDLMPASMVKSQWADATSALMRRWVVRNKDRPLIDHPSFAQVVIRPLEGMPGIYLVRIPPLRFSPLMPAPNYDPVMAWAIFETLTEFEEIEAYLQTPGASFFERAPFFRMRPPSSDRPARLAGGIREGLVCTIETPWPAAKAFSVFTVPDRILAARSAKFRDELHRGRYAVGSFPDRAAADRFWAGVLKGAARPEVVVAVGSVHPRVGARSWAAGQAGRTEP